MDLNIDNYNTQDLLAIFDIKYKSIDNVSIDLIQNKLDNKIRQLKHIDNNELNNENIDNKTDIIDFFYKSFIKLSNAIKDSEQNLIIHQDSHFLIKPNENLKQEVYQTNYKSGKINPLTIKTLTKIININTRFRDNYNTTQSTDFIINFPYTIKKLLTMKLLNYRLPNTVYTISDKLGSNSFNISNDISNEFINLTNGSYDDMTIVTEINSKLQEKNFDTILVEYNENTGKIIFKSSDNSNFNLNFDFNETTCDFIPPNNINKDQLTLGWLLGFRGDYINKSLKNYNNFNNFNNKYENKSLYESESIFDNTGNSYFLLSINDFKNNHDTVFMSPFNNQSLADNNILAKLSRSCSDCNNIQYPKRIYFGPTDINKLHIKIYDEFGRIIDINNADLNLELECEILYDL